jgi:hypothetical protein
VIDLESVQLMKSPQMTNIYFVLQYVVGKYMPSKLDDCIALMKVHIYMGSPRNPRPRGLRKGGQAEGVA